MADGDVVLNRDFKVDTKGGTRIELVVESSSYPSGYYHRFLYYAPKDGKQILRWDNAHDVDVGPHHWRHAGVGAGIKFEVARAMLLTPAKGCSTSMPDDNYTETPAPVEANFPDTLCITISSAESITE